MPIYEYQSEQDGDVIELIRPMAEADNPVDDPQNKGRTFRRRLSTFMAPASSAPRGGSGAAAAATGGCCPCGKNRGSCTSA